MFFLRFAAFKYPFEYLSQEKESLQRIFSMKEALLRRSEETNEGTDAVPEE